MLSTDRKFLFVHVPKTGGNSIQNVLRRYSDDHIVTVAAHQDGIERFEVRSSAYRTHKHSTLAEYRREYGPDLFARLFKFACVRNPWDRVVSFYFSPHRGQVEWNRGDFVRFISTVQPVAHFLTTEVNSAPSLADAVKNLDLVLRFENLQAEFDQMCRLVGLQTQTLPVRNQSRREGYRRYFDAETVAAVAARFHEEIALFGYSY